jgi:hypothetical protein
LHFRGFPEHWAIMKHLFLTRCAALLAVSIIFAGPSAVADEHEGGGWSSLFNGKDLTGWKLRQDDEAHRGSWRAVSSVVLDEQEPRQLVGEGSGGEGGILFRPPVDHGADILTEAQFGDGEFQLDFMVPRGSNSGVYLMGRYEVQILDSHGRPDEQIGKGDVGAIYNASAPSSNAAKAPGEWQSLRIVFQAPRFDDDGNKTRNAKFLSVTLNGVEIQKDVEVAGPTGGELAGGEVVEGPLMIQGDHGIVALRGIRFKPAAD